MQMPNSARQATAKTGAHSRVSVDCLVLRAKRASRPAIRPLKRTWDGKRDSRVCC